MQLSIKSVDSASPPEARAPGHSARMVIPPVDVAEHSPFLLMAEDWFAPPAGFPTHPHRGIETVTFVLDGELEHADHTGGTGQLGEGDVQFMTAGGGVMHSEMPGPGGVQSLQLWLNLPARLKRVAARYQNILRSDAPAYAQEGVEARVYAGKLGDIVVAHASTWPMTLIDLKIEAGAAFAAPIPAGQRAFAYVLEGEAVPSSSGEGDDALPARAATASRLLIFASPIIDEPVAMGGPFVMNTKEEILEAFADLRAGRLIQ
jgi:redox-sensitive bicupin YhaK (pirin superfamily)